MSVPILLFAAAAAVATPDNSATALTCNLALPHGSQFQLDGYFNGAGLHSNLSDLIKVEGVFASASQELVITSDGTNNHRWRLDNVSKSQKFDASLTRYGSQTSVLIIEQRNFVGRHWARSLIGVGFCNLRRGQEGGKAS